MAYFVSRNQRFIREVYEALSTHFGDRADVTYKDGKVKVKIKHGFAKEIDRLTDEQIKAGVMGGGVKQGINNEEFVLDLS